MTKRRTLSPAESVLVCPSSLPPSPRTRRVFTQLSVSLTLHFPFGFGPNCCNSEGVLLLVSRRQSSLTRRRAEHTGAERSEGENVGLRFAKCGPEIASPRNLGNRGFAEPCATFLGMQQPSEMPKAVLPRRSSSRRSAPGLL